MVRFPRNLSYSKELYLRHNIYKFKQDRNNVTRENFDKVGKKRKKGEKIDIFFFLNSHNFFHRDIL